MVCVRLLLLHLVLGLQCAEQTVGRKVGESKHKLELWTPAAAHTGISLPPSLVST